MADVADIAQEIEQQRIDNLLANHAAKQGVLSRTFCEDCEILIPKERLAILRGICRCVDCQEIYERKQGWTCK
jgi:phage/conjugal plasmid C-4 type zinc finger TraR family protein